MNQIYLLLLSSPFYNIYIRIRHHPKSNKEVLSYWKEHPDLQKYLKHKKRSAFLVQTLKRHANFNVRILEIGCGVGRNLQSLLSAGFHRLEGIEINQKALKLLKTSYPDLAQEAKLYNASIEEMTKTFRDNEFNVVFTMAVLEHIHKDNEWCFHEIARITETLLITIEDEFTVSPIHFPRNYKKIFQSLGLIQIEEFRGYPITGLGRNFIVRVFRKTQS